MIGQTVETEDSMEIIDLDKTIETTFFEGTLEDMEDKIVEENIGMIGTMIIIEVGIGQEKGQFQGIMATIEMIPGESLSLAQNYVFCFGETLIYNRDRSSSNSRSRSGSRASTNRDRIRCYNCREYDHFVRDCSNSIEERDLEQLQQMLNMEAEEQTHLLSNRQDSPTENYRNPLNLWMVGMAPLHSYPYIPE